MRLISVLKEEIDRQRLINSAISMDYSEQDAEDWVDDLIEKYNNLPKTLTLYRIIRADEFRDIDLKSLGSHYSESKEDLLSNYEFSTGFGDKVFLFTVKVPSRFVNVQESMENNILYPNENEITLLNQGKNVKIVNVDDVTDHSDDFEDFDDDSFSNF